jgi:hypothetical protein
MEHGNLENNIFLSNRQDFELGERKCARLSASSPDIAWALSSHWPPREGILVFLGLSGLSELALKLGLQVHATGATG